MFYDYFENQFMKDFRTMKFDGYKNLMGEPEHFYGGYEWEDIEKNLEGVADENKEYFVMALYFLDLVDMNMYSNFQLEYPDFRKMTMFPKFGYVGMGPHYQYPQDVILFAAQNGVIKLTNIKEKADEYVDVFFKEYESNHEAGIFPVETKDFFRAVLTDEENLTDDKENVAATIMKQIKKRIDNEIKK